MWGDSTFAGGTETASRLNDAVLTLLATRWYGDRVCWCPDTGACFENPVTPLELELRDDPDRPYSFDDVTGLFSDAEGRYGVDWGTEDYEAEEIPYGGPFDTCVEHWRFVVNLTKGQYIDRARAAVRKVLPGAVTRDDAFPVLLVPTDHAEMMADGGLGQLGAWFGDAITATNDRPGDGFEELWATPFDDSMPIGLDDGELLEIVCEGAPSAEDDPKGWRDHVDARLTSELGIPRRRERPIWLLPWDVDDAVKDVLWGDLRALPPGTVVDVRGLLESSEHVLRNEYGEYLLVWGGDEGCPIELDAIFAILEMDFFFADFEHTVFQKDPWSAQLNDSTLYQDRIELANGTVLMKEQFVSGACASIHVVPIHTQRGRQS